MRQVTLLLAGALLALGCSNGTDPDGQDRFRPGSNTTLSGRVSLSSFTIPAGVTVTASADLVLRVSGDVTIAGDLQGDCTLLDLSATGVLSVTGNISNACSTAVISPPALTLVGKAGYRFTGATTTSSGEVLVSNDPTLPLAAPPAPGGLAQAATYDCVSDGRAWIAAPNPGFAAANSGPVGAVGKPGSKWTLACRGNALFSNTTVRGQAGGRGGDGADFSDMAATATGGAGGTGGHLLVHVTGRLDFTGVTVLRSGAGGAGGAATALGQQNATLPAAPPATAVGGSGGDGGAIGVRGLGGLSVAGSLELAVGAGGEGGDVIAKGGPGAAASLDRDAQPGGAATATGGDGGNAPAANLVSPGPIGGGGVVNLSEAIGGAGGSGDATGGGGGGGASVRRDGASGGAIVAYPGRGGSSSLGNLATNGDVVFRGGNGGGGFGSCAPGNGWGGMGGRGGHASGGNLRGGGGGTVSIVRGSNGGFGGGGLGSGLGGPAGENHIAASAGAIASNPVFTPGSPGSGCTFHVTLTVEGTPDPGLEDQVHYAAISLLYVLVQTDRITIAAPLCSGVSCASSWIAVSSSATVSPESPTLQFVALGAGSAAGNPNVPVRFEGSLDRASGNLTGLVTLSIGTGVSYRVAGRPRLPCGWFRCFNP